jgi:hypothetical protein
MSQDTGLWGIYFVTDAYNQENMVFNIAQEWMRLCTSVTDFEVGILGSRGQGLRDNFYSECNCTSCCCGSGFGSLLTGRIQIRPSF